MSVTIRHIPDGSIKARLSSESRGISAPKVDKTGKWLLCTGHAVTLWRMEDVTKALQSNGTPPDIQPVFTTPTNPIAAKAYARIPFDSWSFGGQTPRPVDPGIRIRFPETPVEADELRLADVTTDGLTAIVAGWDPNVKIWDLRALKSSRTPIRDLGLVTSMVRDTQRSLLALRDVNTHVWLFDYARRDVVWQMNVAREDATTWPNSLMLQAGSVLGISRTDMIRSTKQKPPKTIGLQVKNLKTGEMTGSIAIDGQIGWTRVSTDGQFVLLGNSAPSYRILNIEAVQTRGAQPRSESVSALRLFDNHLKEVGNGFSAHLKPGVKQASFSPLGKLATSLDERGTIRLFEMQTLKKVGEFPVSRECIDLVPTDDGLVVTALFGSISCYKGATGERIAMVETAHTRPIRHIAISPSGTILATAGDDHTIRLWKMPGLTPIGGFEHNSREAGLVIFLDDHTLAYGGERLRILNTSDAIDLDKEMISGLVSGAYRIDLSKDGRLLAAAGYNGILSLLDRNSRKQIGMVVAHKDGVKKVAFLGNSNQLISAGKDGVKKWDLEKTTQPLGAIAKVPSDFSLFVSPDGAYCVVIGNYRATVWRTSDMKQVGGEIAPASGEIHFSKDSSKVAFTTGFRGMVHDLASAKFIAIEDVSPDTFELSLISKKGPLLVQHLTSGETRVLHQVAPELARMDEGRGALVLADRNQVATASNGYLWIYSADHASMIWAYELSHYVQDIAYDSHRQELLTADGEGTVCIWKLPPKKP